MPWVRRVVKFFVFAAIAIALLWLGLSVFLLGSEPSSNRVYAETWEQAPISELLQVQGEPQDKTPRPDGAPGAVYHYHFGPWRGMKGRFYPGTILGELTGNRYMQSGVHIYTAPAGAHCDIDFTSNGADLIEAIAYSGNDCG